jgi:hypothetical protein
MRGIGWSLADERALSSRERGLLRQGSGPARQTLGFVRQTYGFVRQTYGFARQTYGFARQTYGFVRQTYGFVRQTYGFVRQTYGFVRQTYGFVRQTYGFVRQTYGFYLKKRVFAFFPSKTSEISNFITLPILSESSPCASAAGGISIIILPVNCSRWGRRVSFRVAAHETFPFDDCGGGVGGVWEERTRSTHRNQYRSNQAGEGNG